MHDDDPEGSQLDSPPEFDGVLEAIAAAPRPRVSNHARVQLPEPLTAAFVNEPDRGPPRTPRTGDVIDQRYRIEDILGSGGMGVVFSATHLATGRRVALKWLQLASMYRTENEREAALKRFGREAKAAGRIRHPNVVDVHDAGSSAQAPFLVMELLEGETLRARIDRGQLSWEEALQLLLPAMEGVGEAHRRGVVHRDLKPDNLFLARQSDGSLCPKVLDFGVSLLHPLEAGEPHASLTRTGTALGTPAYMPLEQLRAEGDVDARTDVYALGVMLYEMLTQKRPYVARNAADFAALMASEKPTPLSRHRPDLRGHRERAVMKALERDSSDRHASVDAFANALRGAGRSPRSVGAWAAVILSLAAISVWFIVQPARPERVAKGAHASPGPVEHAAPGASPPQQASEPPPQSPQPASGPPVLPKAEVTPIERHDTSRKRPNTIPPSRPPTRSSASKLELQSTDFESSLPSPVESVSLPEARAKPPIDLGREQF